jgi:hypothetical protein
MAFAAPILPDPTRRPARAPREASPMPLPSPHTGHEHHARIRASIDRVPALADMLEQQPLPATFAPAFEAQLDFVEDTLLPHIEVVETLVYQELARMLEDGRPVAPLRREDVELTDLARVLASYRPAVASGRPGMPEAMALRRALYRLYALVKVHLAEEEVYLRVIEGRATAHERRDLERGLEHALAL